MSVSIVRLKPLNNKQSEKFRDAYKKSGLNLEAIQRAKEIAKRGFSK